MPAIKGAGNRALAADRVPVFDSFSGTETASIDRESISFNGEFAECRVDFIYQNPQPLDDGRYYSTIKMRVVIDGPRKLWASKYGIYYANHGGVVDSESMPDAVATDTIVPDSMMCFVCQFLSDYAANSGD